MHRWHCGLLLSAAEQRVRIKASEQRREYNEEQRNEYENYVEEERDGKTWIRLLLVQKSGSRTSENKFLQVWNKEETTIHLPLISPPSVHLMRKMEPRDWQPLMSVITTKAQWKNRLREARVFVWILDEALSSHEPVGCSRGSETPHRFKVLICGWPQTDNLLCGRLWAW